jgi:hypothetical protein
MQPVDAVEADVMTSPRDEPACTFSIHRLRLRYTARMKATQGFVLALVAVCSLLFAARVEAQADVATLRAEVASLRGTSALRPGVFNSLDYMLDVSERIERTFEPQSIEWRRRVERYLAIARQGRDPYEAAQGRITSRGYDSPISTIRQGYTVYTPPDYDPNRAYPLMIMLHGGSSNGNLFLGVVLGNNMDWLTYNQHLWDEYTPRWSPDWIVVAPDGFGQVLWRWMGEVDILSVLEDVQRNYNVDPDRVVLGGLSNGGVGAYSVGMRHAWRFSAVQAIAGAPSWLQYAGGRPTSEERDAMMQWSGMHLIENSLNTNFRFYHGHLDGGPMRPAYVTQLEAFMRNLNIEPRVTWFDAGHDLLYLVHRHGNIYPQMATIVRNRRPAEVRVVTGDYAANRQHWVTVTRIENYPTLARVVATAAEGAITVTTNNALEFTLDLRDAPIGDAATLRISVDGATAHEGPRAPLGHVVTLHREGTSWSLGTLPPAQGLEKVPGLSGPLTAPYRDGMIHVYGTQIAAQTAALRASAERGARGWPLWLWNHQQRVVADTDVTPEMMAASHLVLYGTPGANSVLERVCDRLPIRVEADAITVGGRRFAAGRSREIGVRFVYPNPDAPTRYLIVQAGTNTAAVDRGHNLPDFLPDWIVYDARTARTRQRLIGGPTGNVGMGYFDRFWQVPTGPQALLRAVPSGDDEMLAGPQLDVTTLAGYDGGSFLGGDDGPPATKTTPREAARERRARLRERRAQLRAVREQRARILGVTTRYVIPPLVLTQTPTITLPISEPPANPAAPTTFAAEASDPAGIVAREIAALVPSFMNFRGIVPGARWTSDADHQWQIRAQQVCLADLSRQHIDATLVDDEFPTPVATPVELPSEVDGVAFRTVRPGERILVSCELAARLHELTRVLRAHHIHAVDVLSAYRPTPQQSFHTLGLALDLFAFEREDGTMLSVLDHFIETPDAETCDAPAPAGEEARELLAIACELGDAHFFSTVLTPNYNDGHRNHFHIDARPDDPRFYVR